MMVSIVDKPHLVLSLDDVEVVSLERLDQRIKTFDVVFIFRDYKTTQMISNISKDKMPMIME